MDLKPVWMKQNWGSELMPCPSHRDFERFGQESKKFSEPNERMFISDTRQANQFCTFRPGMRRNSRSLLVTIVRPAALACAAIHKSLLPTGCPWASSAARNIPYVSPAFSGIGRTGTKVLNSASNCRTFLRCLLFSAPYSSSPHVITDIAASPGSSFWKRSNTFPGLWRWM